MNGRKHYRWLGDPRLATNDLVTDRERNQRAWMGIRGRLQMAYYRETSAIDRVAAAFGVPLIY